MIRLRFVRILPSGLLIAAVSIGWAQDRNHAIVVKAARRAIAPPLSQVAPIPPGQSAVDEDRLVLRQPGAPEAIANPAAQAGDTSPLAALTPLTTNTGLNVLGIGAGFTGYTKQAVIVPDTSLAVGPAQFVEFVNDSFAVFDKSTGNPVTQLASGDTLWTLIGAPCAGTPHLDEIAQYDKLANRWVMMMVASTGAALCIAVSQTSDAASGGWYLYEFPIPGAPCVGSSGTCHYAPDYPKLAVWPDAYYVSYNQAAGGTAFEGGAVCALDRTNMLLGPPNTPATMQCFVDIDPNYGFLLPADLDGINPPPSGTPEYFLNFDNSTPSVYFLDLWQFHVDWTTPANSTFGSTTSPPWAPNNQITIPAFTEPCGETGVQITYTTGDCIPQQKTTMMLDSYGDRLMYRLAYRNLGTHQSLLANQTIEAGGSGPTAIQWYELQDTGAGFNLYQQGFYPDPPDTEYRWQGSIAMDQSGDIALGYNISGSDMSPSIRYTGRVPTDPAGTMESEIDILSQAPNGGIKPASQSGTFHWADYATMAVDPVDDCTFWFATEYIPTGGGNWATRIASFSFPSCSGPTLSVNLSGNGVVTSSPAGISCPSGACSSAFVSGTAVSLSAAAASGSVFTGWKNACSGTSSCNLTVTGPSSVVATFTPGFIVTAAPTPQTVSAGGSASYSVAVAGVQGFSNGVTLACTAPTAQGVNCSLASTSVTPGNSVKLTVTTTAPSTAMVLPPGGVPRAISSTWILFPVLAFVGIAPIGLRSKKHKLSVLLASALLAGLILLQFGCGGSNNSGGQQVGGTPAGTYTVNITATSGSTTVPTVSVTIVVQ